MTDFLGRLAARNSESLPPALAPRAASRFEVSPLAIQHDAVEVTAAPQLQRSAPKAPDAPRVTERRAAEVHEPSVPPTARSQPEDLRPAERATPMRTRVEQILRDVETLVSVAPIAEPRREVVRERQIVASPVVPRIEKAPESRQITLARTGLTGSAPESEPTVIRVHIGRVEVRSTPTPAERPRVRAAKQGDLPKPMSLDRYLSGKDRA